MTMHDMDETMTPFMRCNLITALVRLLALRHIFPLLHLPFLLFFSAFRTTFFILPNGFMKIETQTGREHRRLSEDKTFFFSRLDLSDVCTKRTSSPFGVFFQFALSL